MICRFLYRLLLILAEEEGFEPPSPVKGCRFSRPMHSTALPLLCVSVKFWECKCMRLNSYRKN